MLSSCTPVQGEHCSGDTSSWPTVREQHLTFPVVCDYIVSVNISSCGSAWMLWYSDIGDVTMWLKVLLVHFTWSQVTCFNLDTEHGVVYQGDQDSLFGFSVAAHRDQQTGWWVNINNVVLWSHPFSFISLRQSTDGFYLKRHLRCADLSTSTLIST